MTMREFLTHLALGVATSVAVVIVVEALRRKADAPARPIIIPGPIVPGHDHV